MNNRNTKCSKPIFRLLINSGFKGVNRLLVSPANAIDDRILSRYYLPTEKVEDYNIMINGKTFLIKQLKEI